MEGIERRVELNHAWGWREAVFCSPRSSLSEGFKINFSFIGTIQLYWLGGTPPQ